MSKEEPSARWRRLINEQTESGLSAAAFCRDRKVCRKSFYTWRKRFMSEAVPGGTANEGFSELVAVPGSGGRAWSGVNILLGPSRAIGLECGFDTATLQAVLSVVDVAMPT